MPGINLSGTPALPKTHVSIAELERRIAAGAQEILDTITTPPIHRIVLPYTRANELLNANQRQHWAQRNKVTQHWRERAAWAAKEAKIPHLERAHILMHIGFADKRRRDVHNFYLTGKAIVDGLVDAGVLPDDNDAHLVGPDMRPHLERVRAIVVEIYPLAVA